MCPMLKEMRKYALKHLTLKLTSSYHGCHLDTSGSFHSVRNLLKQKKTIRPQPRFNQLWDYVWALSWWTLRWVIFGSRTANLSSIKSKYVHSELSMCPTTIKSHHQWSSDTTSHHGNPREKKRSSYFIPLGLEVLTDYQLMQVWAHFHPQPKYHQKINENIVVHLCLNKNCLCC